MRASSLLLGVVSCACGGGGPTVAEPDAGAADDAGTLRDASTPNEDAGLDAGPCRIPRGGEDGAVLPPQAAPLHHAIATIVAERPLAAAAVAIARGDELRYAEAFGQADPAHGIAATVQTPFLLASSSKTVIAVAVLQLAERGLLDLDGDVSDQLGYEVRNPFRPETPLTTRMFLTHTSTLWDLPFTWDETYFVTGDPEMGITEFVAGYFDPESPWFGGPDAWWPEDPGRFHCYSNMGVAVLGALVEQVSGMPLEEYGRTNIFEPLGMARTSWRIDAYCDPGELARGVRWDEESGAFVDHDNGATGQPEGHPEIASGMLRSSLLDMIRFAMAIGGGSPGILSPDSVTTMLTRQLDDQVESCGDGRVAPSEQAMLWFHMPDATGADWVGHYGGMNGVATSVWLLGGDAMRYVVLLNESDLEGMNEIEIALLENADAVAGQ